MEFNFFLATIKLPNKIHFIELTVSNGARLRIRFHLGIFLTSYVNTVIQIIIIVFTPKNSSLNRKILKLRDATSRTEKKIK